MFVLADAVLGKVFHSMIPEKICACSDTHAGIGRGRLSLRRLHSRDHCAEIFLEDGHRSRADL